MKIDPQRDQLVAYLATLGALVVVVIAALIASANGVTVSEALGVSIAIGGLIGVLRLPQQRSVTVDNPPSDPVPTQDAEQP
jgi:membrane associated rhomboid family serine protease